MNPAVNRSPQSPQPKPPEKLVRPTRPEPPAPAKTSERKPAVPAPPPEKPPEAEEPKARQQPIPPPGEPMQYRAIGLVRGQYLPSAEQFTQGMLLTEDETLIDSVLLGRVMSLVKNHIDLSQPHLWVVYPRTRKEDDKLHLQIVGVWEPETLDRENEAERSTSSEQAGDSAEEAIVDGYFSIRGEVVYQSQPEQQIVVKIKQLSRQQSEKSKFFKLHLQCALADKMVGHFWDLQVMREERLLVVREAKDIGFLPLKKKAKPAFSKRPIGQKPQLPKREERLPMATSPSERKPLPKPVKRQGPLK